MVDHRVGVALDRIPLRRLGAAIAGHGAGWARLAAHRRRCLVGVADAHAADLRHEFCIDCAPGAPAEIAGAGQVVGGERLGHKVAGPVRREHLVNRLSLRAEVVEARLVGAARGGLGKLRLFAADMLVAGADEILVETLAGVANGVLDRLGHVIELLGGIVRANVEVARRAVEVRHVRHFGIREVVPVEQIDAAVGGVVAAGEVVHTGVVGGRVFGLVGQVGVGFGGHLLIDAGVLADETLLGDGARLEGCHALHGAFVPEIDVGVDDRQLVLFREVGCVLVERVRFLLVVKRRAEGILILIELVAGGGA